MGVKRAMQMALEESGRSATTIYTLGPLIHTPQAIELLRSRRVEAVEGEPPENSGATILIRAHGVPPEVRQRLKERGFRVRDATCPNVAHAQGIVKMHASKGYSTVICGDDGHAEVVGLLGYAQGRGYVVREPEDVDRLPELDRVCMVGQTTQSGERYNRVCERAQARFKDCLVFDTLCDATFRNQEEVKKLAKQADVVIVVGGKNSGNTARLAEVARSLGTTAYHIETEAELDSIDLSPYRVAAVTAGASTPTWITNRVVEKLEGIYTKETNPLGVAIYRALRFLINSNLYAAAGAAAVCYANTRLQSLPVHLLPMLASAFYLFAMHILHNLGGRGESDISQPSRAVFLARHRRLFLACAIGAAAVALGIGFGLGALPFALMLLSILAGLLYSLEIVPGFIQRRLGYRRLRDIPASRDLFLALAWAAMTVLLPLFAIDATQFSLATVFAFVFTFVLLFMRSVLLDIRDIHSDRALGRETIPIVIGTENCKRLLFGLCALAGVWVIIACALNWVVMTALVYLLCVAYTVATLFLYHRRIIFKSIWCDTVTDGNFLLYGALAGLLSF